MRYFYLKFLVCRSSMPCEMYKKKGKKWDGRCVEAVSEQLFMFTPNTRRNGCAWLLYPTSIACDETCLSLVWETFVRIYYNFSSSSCIGNNGRFQCPYVIPSYLICFTPILEDFSKIGKFLLFYFVTIALLSRISCACLLRSVPKRTAKPTAENRQCVPQGWD